MKGNRMSTPSTIYNWTAKRSGAALSVFGRDDRDEPVKATVAKIEASAHGATATTPAGVTIRLVKGL